MSGRGQPVLPSRPTDSPREHPTGSQRERTSESSRERPTHRRRSAEGGTLAAFPGRDTPWPSLHRQPVRVRRAGWWLLEAVAAVTVPTFLVLGSWWQQITRDLAGVERTDRADYLLILLLALGVGVVILIIARAIRRGTAALTRLVSRFVPTPAARLIAHLRLVDGTESLSQRITPSQLGECCTQRLNAVEPGQPGRVGSRAG